MVMVIDPRAPDDRLAEWLPALMQLASPTLPIGSFSYSQGREAAAWAGLVVDEASALAWIDSHWGQSFAVREWPAVHRPFFYNLLGARNIYSGRLSFKFRESLRKE